MRQIWFRGMTIAAAIVLAAAMVGINYAFEAAGSVPDLDGCGFIAGNLLALLVIYPLTSGFIASRASRLLLRAYPDADEGAVRLGGRACALGATAYFAGGLMTVATGGHAAQIPAIAWLVLPLYTFLCYVAGRFGASLAVESSVQVAFQNEG